MIYVGCTLKPVENWQAILPAPTAPVNYKDPKKIDAYVQDKLVELMNGKAATHPLSGSIGDAVMFKGTDSGKNRADAKSGVELIDQLAKIYVPNSVPVCGYKIYRNLRLAATAYLAERGPLPESLRWLYDPRAYGVHTLDTIYFDPVSVIFGTSDEDKIDAEGVCRRLDIEANLNTSLGLAEFACALALKLYPDG